MFKYLLLVISFTGVQQGKLSLISLQCRFLCACGYLCVPTWRKVFFVNCSSPYLRLPSTVSQVGLLFVFLLFLHEIIEKFVENFAF